MNEPPQNPINPNKIPPNKIKDLSFNYPFLDISGIIFKNPVFFPLGGCNKIKKNILLNDIIYIYNSKKNKEDEEDNENKEDEEDNENKEDKGDEENSKDNENSEDNENKKNKENKKNSKDNENSEDNENEENSKDNENKEDNENSEDNENKEDEENKKNKEDEENKKSNDIKNFLLRFDMRLDSILDNINNKIYNNNSKNNSKNNTLSLENIKNTLDKRANTMGENQLVIFNNVIKEKEGIDDLLLQITKKYDLAGFNSNYARGLYQKSCFLARRNLCNSVYIPPHKYYRNGSYVCSPKQISYSKTFLPKYVPRNIQIKKEYKTIDTEINGIKDLLRLIEDYPLSPNIEYNINMRSIHDIKEPLNELNNMVGMHGLKNSIVDQIVYFVQNLHINKNAAMGDFMHTCIYGPPGTGKTEIAKLMGKIFSSLGILKKKYFRKVTRADLIAGYLGQTAIKTRDVIKDALGGVLFIDEAYALGNPEKRDSFAKECIDTLCEALSDNKEQLMVIIAGYEDDLKKCFFGYNQGLNSRFPWRFKTDNYTGAELNMIFKKKVAEAGWSIKEEITDEWFETKADIFTFYGRDMETLLAKTKIAHGRRVFCKPPEEKTKIIMKDLQRGYDMFIDNNEVKERKNNACAGISNMYL